MKQLKESILDNDFDVNVGFLDVDFINNGCFDLYIRSLRSSNLKLCAQLFGVELKKCTEKFLAMLDEIGVDLKNISLYDKTFRSSTFFSVVNDFKDFKFNEVISDDLYERVKFFHEIDEWMDKNVRGWKDVPCRFSPGYDDEDSFDIHSTDIKIGDKIMKLWEPLTKKKFGKYKIEMQSTPMGIVYLYFTKD